jgi:hypothetical protein
MSGVGPDRARPYSAIQAATGCSRATIAKLAKRVKPQAA